MKILDSYLIVINILAFVLYGIDKWKAKKHKWRISEATLLGVASIGGSIGALVGIYFFHHKTRHKKFILGVPAMIVVQCYVIWWVVK